MQSELETLIGKYTQAEVIDFPTYLQHKKREASSYPLPLRNDIKAGYVVVASSEAIERMIYAKSFRQLGYETFIVEKPSNDNAMGRIAIAPLKNDLEAILWIGSGLDFDESLPVEIVKTLALWRDYCSFNVIGAGTNWVLIDFESLPSNVETFAAMIIEFCPNVLTSAIRNERDLAELLQNERTLTLRWRSY
jgi:hypothetical protein